MSDEIVERIERELGIPGLAEMLAARLAPTDLQSLLLAVARPYYDGATFAVSIAGAEVVEGGFVDWTQKLLGDRKERLLTSAVGLDLLAGIVDSRLESARG